MEQTFFKKILSLEKFNFKLYTSNELNYKYLDNITSEIMFIYITSFNDFNLLHV